MERWVPKLVRVGVYILYASVVCLIGVEVALRAFNLAPTDGAFTVSEREFQRIPGIFAPDRSFIESRIAALPHRVTIDTLGYRGARSFPRQPADEELRVVVAGDSFVWGDHVDDAETLPAQLEALLRGRCENVTVINAGVPSTSIDAQVEMVLRSLPVGPQLAIVVFQDGDLVELLGGSIWDELAENRAAKARFPLSVAYPVLRRTALWNLALDIRRRLLLRSQPLTAMKVRDPASVAISEDQAKPLYVAHLSSLADTLRTLEIPLVLAAYPGSQALHSGEAAAVGSWAVTEARGMGLPALNLRHVLESAALPDSVLYLYPHDGHPSPLGYSLTAGALAEKLVRLPLVREHCGHAGRAVSN